MNVLKMKLPAELLAGDLIVALQSRGSGWETRVLTVTGLQYISGRLHINVEHEDPIVLEQQSWHTPLLVLA